MNIYVGNLPLNVSLEQVRKKFEAYGQVGSVNIITDKFSGHGLGFGFVEMPSDKEAACAIEALNRTKIEDRVVMVSEAKARVERRSAEKK